MSEGLSNSKFVQQIDITNLQFKNIQGCIFLNVPAGVFCTLLASTPSICKKDYYKGQTVNLPRLFQKRIFTKNSPRHIKSGMDAAGSKQHNFFTNNQLSIKHGKRYSVYFFISHVLSDWDNLIQFVIDNLITETCTVLVYKFPSFINYKLAIKQKEFLT